MGKGKDAKTAKKSENKIAESEEVNHSLTKIVKGAGIVFIGMFIGRVIGY